VVPGAGTLSGATRPRRVGCAGGWKAGYPRLAQPSVLLAGGKLNSAISRCCWSGLNQGDRFRKLPGSRQSAFEQPGSPALAWALPEASPCLYFDGRGAGALDYPRLSSMALYSVPYQLVKKQAGGALDARYGVNASMPNQRVSPSQPRFNAQGPAQHAKPRHMPKSHRETAEWTPQRTDRAGRTDRAEHRRVSLSRRRVHRSMATCLLGPSCGSVRSWRKTSGSLALAARA